MSYPGGTSLAVNVAIPRQIEKGKQDCSLRVTVEYISDAGTGELVDSGPVRIAATTTLGPGPINKRTVEVQVKVPLGGRSVPGANENYNATVQLTCAGGAGEEDETS